MIYIHTQVSHAHTQLEDVPSKEPGKSQLNVIRNVTASVTSACQTQQGDGPSAGTVWQLCSQADSESLTS